MDGKVEKPEDRWKSSELVESIKIFKGVPKEKPVDNSPNKGSNWMRGK